MLLCFHCMTSEVWFGFLGLSKPKHSNEIREFSLNSQLEDQDLSRLGSSLLFWQ